MFRTLLFTGFLAIVFFIAERYYAVPWLHASWKAILVFFVSVSLLTHRLVETGLQGNQERFVPLYLAATVARFIVGLIFVGFFLLQSVADRRTFVLDFLVLYIIYTGFEVWGIHRKLRQNS
ncbi:Na+-transporting NADH:ubiquinone oxidoreductase subunit NqrB [Spirosoma lacussanchae]